MKKALIVMSVASMVKQFNIPNIQLLQELGYHVTVATNYENPGNIPVSDSIELMKVLENNNVKTHNIQFGRSPLEKSNIKAYHQLKELISNEKYELIHCQSPIGGVLTRLALKKSQVKNSKLIYTAHGFHFYKGAPLKNWLIFYPIERYYGKYTDDLITINEEDYHRALRAKLAKRVHLVNGVGIDTQKFKPDQKKAFYLKEELSLSNDAIILTSIGELNENKNHQEVIKALSILENTNVHYVVCGRGKLELQLKKLANQLGVNLHLLGFRKDIDKILNGSDIFVFPSKREGLPVSLMEAMASGLPIIASNIRGNRDLVVHGKGGFLFELENQENLTLYLKKLINSQVMIEESGQFNLKKIQEYDFKTVNRQMTKVYMEE